MTTQSEFYCKVCAKDYHDNFRLDRHKESDAHKRLVALHKNVHNNIIVQSKTATNSTGIMKPKPTLIEALTAQLVDSPDSSKWYEEPPPTDIVPYTPMTPALVNYEPSPIIVWLRQPSKFGLPRGLWILAAIFGIGVMPGVISKLTPKGQASSGGISGLLPIGGMALGGYLLTSKMLRTELKGWLGVGKDLNRFFKDWEK